MSEESKETPVDIDELEIEICERIDRIAGGTDKFLDGLLAVITELRDLRTGKTDIIATMEAHTTAREKTVTWLRTVKRYVNGSAQTFFDADEVIAAIERGEHLR